MDAKAFLKLKNVEQLFTMHKYDGLIVYLIEDKTIEIEKIKKEN